MTFLNPSYLWALSGLAIPLAIHLLSRKEGKVIRVGSLRHLEESNTSQFKSVRLNEILLLLLRMLMIVLLVLFMSGAQCSGTGPGKKIVYAEHGLDADSLTSKGYELHEIPQESYWTFAEELNKSPYETIVISYSKAGNFRGERISLNENIKWITKESPAKDFQALAWRVGDSVFVRTGKSNEMITTYSTSVEVPDSIQIVVPKNVRVSSENKFVVAALNVLKKVYRLPIEVTKGAGDLDKKFAVNDQDAALNEDLVIELFKELYPELQRKEPDKDARVMPDKLAWSSHVTTSSRSAVTLSGIEKYLIMFFILTLALERGLAIKKNQ